MLPGCPPYHLHILAHVSSVGSVPYTDDLYYTQILHYLFIAAGVELDDLLVDGDLPGVLKGLQIAWNALFAPGRAGDTRSTGATPTSRDGASEPCRGNEKRKGAVVSQI